MTMEHHTRLIKEKASEYGFSFCGISKAGRLDEEAKHLELWLKQNRHGSMQYMENHFDKRVDPTVLMPGAKSVISLMYNYFPAQKQHAGAEFKLAKYAYGDDYHDVIKQKLKQFIASLQEQVGDFHARVFVDSAPVLEKAWARKSGLGWVGKHTNIINAKAGSFFFLAEIICDLELEYDGPVKDHCGTCTACIDACPTDALHEPYRIDASRCISYLTIELKDAAIPGAFKNNMESWIFGCDICQDVCPWNRFSKPHHEPAFVPNNALMEMQRTEWIEMTEEIFKELFRNSAVKRTKYAGLKRNIAFAGKSV